MKKQHHVWWATLLGFASVVGCIEADESAELDDETLADVEQQSLTPVGTTFWNGTKLVYEDVTNPTNINLQNVTGITACDEKALYALEPVTSGLITVKWVTFSNDGGQTWTRKFAGHGGELACDHAQLLSLDNGVLKAAKLSTSGGAISSPVWATVSTPTTFTKINGGDGTFYAIKSVATGKDIYIASDKAIHAPLQFTKIANFGGMDVTGVGTNYTGSDNVYVGNAPGWTRRAFGLETDGSLITAPDLIAGTNLWTTVYTGNERYTSITAASANVLYGLQTKNGVQHLQRVTITEDNCTDGIDNDRNGLKDGEDEACEARVAQTYCDAHGEGSYCADRYLPAASLLLTNNANPRMLLCTTAGASYTLRGVCKRNANSAITNADALQSTTTLRPVDPPNTARYCNMHWPDGSWRLRWGISDPCATLAAGKPNGTIVRAGLYSTTGGNNVHAFCNGTPVAKSGASGDAPLYDVYNAVTSTYPTSTGRCTFVITATELPLFSNFFNPSHQSDPNAHARPFVHNRKLVELSQFGQGQPQGAMGYVDRFGKKTGDAASPNAPEPAYDHYLSESRPLYAAADGQVVTNGARFRDLPSYGGTGAWGTPNQGEVYIKYSIGTDATYAETFVVYYAHLRKMLVKSGQVVKRGQLIGWVGATGSTSGGYAHMHSGVMRLSNTNLHTQSGNALPGYHVDFAATMDDTGTNIGSDVSVDPLGWANYAAFDPFATEAITDEAYDHQNESDTLLGRNAWSLNLFKPGQAFLYP